MKPPMLHTAYKIGYARNEYGDFVATTSTPLACHIRIITEQVTTVGNEQIQSDAMAWFEADSGVEKQDILNINGQHYRVERVTEARRLRETQVQFLKVDLLKYGTIS